MPIASTLWEEAESLSQETLEAGVVDTFKEDPNVNLTGKLHFRAAESGKTEWHVETEMSRGESARSKTSEERAATGGAKRRKMVVETKMLSRDANTTLAAQTTLSDKTSQVDVDVYNEAKKTSFDFGRYQINGTGIGPFPNGIEYYLDAFNGVEQPSGSYEMHSSGDRRVSIERKIYATSNGRIGGTRQPLDAGMIEDLITNHDGSSFDFLVVSRKVRIWMFQMLTAYPGTVPQDINSDRLKGLGSDTLSWRGLPVVWNPFVGTEKWVDGVAGKFGAALASGDTTLTVAQPGDEKDDMFIGFSSLDVGRSVTISDNDGTDPFTTTIVSVSGDRRTVEVANAPTKAYQYASLHVETETNVLYGVRTGKDANAGWCAVYNEIDAATKAQFGYEQANPIMGLVAVDLGRQTNRVRTHQIDWFGNFRANNVHCIARLSHFAAPSV